jgi:adenylate kinase
MKKNKLAIVMLGAPGSGKGTQGELLEKHTGFKRYVMSDLIKSELKPGNKLYDKIFKQGILLNDNNIFDIFRKYFGSEEEIILDGLPRTLDQAYWLYGFLLRHKYEIELVFLNVDENKLLSRITSRRYCPKCHRLYNTETKKPKKIGFCDDDNSELIQREDDTKQVFGERLQIFDEVRDVILDVYKGDIIEVNGDQNIDIVSRDILKKIIVRN